MAKKSNREKKPMLYITQPDFEEVNPNMQSVYRTERKSLMKKKEDVQATEADQYQPEAPAAEEKVAQKNQTATEVVNKERPKRNAQRKKRFTTDLGLGEKSQSRSYDPFLGRQDPFAVENVETKQQKDIDLQEPHKGEEEPIQKLNAPAEDMWDALPQEVTQEEAETNENDTEEQVFERNDSEERNSATEEAEENAQERKRVSFTNRNRRSRFKDMSLEDKVDYFVNLPSQVPRMKCEVIAGEERYKGWIEDYQDGIVHMKILQRPFRVEVPFDQIDDIVLRGF